MNKHIEEVDDIMHECALDGYSLNGKHLERHISDMRELFYEACCRAWENGYDLGYVSKSLEVDPDTPLLDEFLNKHAEPDSTYAKLYGKGEEDGAS